MSRQYRNPAGGAILGLLLCAVPGAASAISLVDYGISARSTAGVDGESVQVPVNSPFSVNAASGSSSASISYSPGVVGLVAATSWPSGDPNSTQFGSDHSASASIGIFDSITMARPPNNSDIGASLTFTIQLTGSLAETNGFANWLLQEASFQAPLYRDATTFALVQPLVRIEPVDGTVDGDFGSRGQSLPVTLVAIKPVAVANATDVFLFDTPYDMRWRFAVNVNGNPAGPGEAGSASANLGNTILWLGITARDSQGDIIEGLQFTSESGYDWGEAAVVPLPATAWLLVTALGAVAAAAARSRPPPNEQSAFARLRSVRSATIF